MGYWDDVNPSSIENAQDGFMEFKIGDNEAYVKMAEERTSKNGNPMLVITFANDEGAEIEHYIVENEFKLSKLKQFYIAFGIPFGNRDIEEWRGKRGIVVCKRGEPYDGKTFNKVSYLRPKLNSTPPNANSVQRNQSPQQSDLPQGSPVNPPPKDGFYDDIPF